jgi:hypothetical protein
VFGLRRCRGRGYCARELVLSELQLVPQRHDLKFGLLEFPPLLGYLLPRMHFVVAGT